MYWPCLNSTHSIAVEYVDVLINRNGGNFSFGKMSGDNEVGMFNAFTPLNATNRAFARVRYRSYYQLDFGVADAIHRKDKSHSC